MDIKIYRRHKADCSDKDDRCAPRCGCPLWLQSNWRNLPTTLDGSKLKRGQNKMACQHSVVVGSSEEL